MSYSLPSPKPHLTNTATKNSLCLHFPGCLLRLRADVLTQVQKRFTWAHSHCSVQAIRANHVSWLQRHKPLCWQACADSNTQTATHQNQALVAATRKPRAQQWVSAQSPTTHRYELYKQSRPRALACSSLLWKNFLRAEVLPVSDLLADRGNHTTEQVGERGDKKPTASAGTPTARKLVN